MKTETVFARAVGIAASAAPNAPHIDRDLI